MRFFNTEGPNRAEDHYSLPPLERWDLDGVLDLIDQKKYFLLHAPRQTGKTTCLLALADYLNQDGRYRAVYANSEGAQVYREQVEKAWPRWSPTSPPGPTTGRGTPMRPTWRDGEPDPLAEELAQLDGYLAGLGLKAAG